MQRQDRKSYPDTIELDKAGNVIRLRSWWSTELRSYDSNGFLQRQRVQSDIVLNYLLRYSLKGNTLQQTWRELRSNDWNLESDTTSRLDHVVLFEHDSKGRIATEVHPGLTIKYFYLGELLTKKDSYTGYPPKVSHGWEYYYDSNAVLKRIVRTYETQEKETTIYLHGLPESGNSVETGGQYKYHYVYFN